VDVKREATIHPALEHALELVAGRDPKLAARAARTLDTLLAGVCRSPRADAWSFSSLTKTGFPVEFAFSTHHPALRYTVEVLGPEAGWSERLPAAEERLRLLGACLDGVVERMRALQHPPGSGWGSWLGVRQRAGGERYKLYAQVSEASPARDAMTATLLGRAPLLPKRQTRLVAVGHVPGSDDIELYYLIDGLGLEYWEITWLLRRCGLGERQLDLLELIEELRGYSLRRTRPPLPAATYGFSLAVDAGGAVRVFSLFTFPDSLLGDDVAIRQALLAAGARRGWDLELYGELSARLAGQRGRDSSHSAIGFVTRAEGPPALHIALSPSEALR
jgi:hypothetical protein